MNKKRNFKLVLLGDEGVGKSTFVYALTHSRITTTQKLPKQDPVQLPPEMFQNQECTTILFDTQCLQHELPDEVKYANVILLMYDISDANSAERLKGFWLKELEKQDCQQPIIVVGNKLDLVDQLTDEEQELFRIFKVIKPLVKESQRVEMGIECSSLQIKGIQDVINCAQRSFIYPLAPIYSMANKQLTTSFKKALTRIFRYCDKDRDGYWSDQELMKFQKKVFKRQLDITDIAGIKDMIQEELKNDSNKYKISLEGFMALQKRGIELMKIQICWTILRHFQYKDDLTLDENLFTNDILIDKQSGQTVELSDQAIEYLKSIFNQINKPYIDQRDIDQIFFPTIHQTHFPSIEQCSNNGTINIDQWISMWNAYAFFNYKETFKQLSYIGYDAKLSDCFKECNRKDSWSSIQKSIERKVFHIAIIVPLKQPILQDLFQSQLNPVIRSYQNKTYIVSLYERNGIDLELDKSFLDFIIIDERVKFQCEELIPSSNHKLQQTSLLQLISEVSLILHQQPFGYSEIQVKALKQMNSFPILQFMFVGVSLFSALMGYVFYKKKHFK